MVRLDCLLLIVISWSLEHGVSAEQAFCSLSLSLSLFFDGHLTGAVTKA